MGRYQLPVYRVALRMLGDRADAEDAAQDAFLQAWQRCRGSPVAAGSTWLYRIVTNRCLNIRRSARRTEPLPDGLEVEAPASRPDQIVEAASELEALAEAIARLSPEQRRRWCCGRSRAARMRRSPGCSASAWPRCVDGCTGPGLSCWRLCDHGRMTDLHAESLPCGADVAALVEQVGDGRAGERSAHQATRPYCQTALEELGRLWAPVDRFARVPVRVPAGMAVAVLGRVRERVGGGGQVLLGGGRA